MTTELVSQEQLTEDIQKTIDEHKDLVVKDDPGFVAAQEAMKVIKGRIKFVEDWFKEPIKKAHEAHKSLTTKRSESLKPLQEIFKNIGGQCSTYQAEQERIAEEKRREEEERLRKEEEDRRLEDAEALEEAGKTEEAEQVLNDPINVAPPPKQAPPKVDSVSYRENWKYEIQNRELIPRDFMKPDEVKIGQFVRAMKEKASIKGVRIWAEKSPIVR